MRRWFVTGQPGAPVGEVAAALSRALGLPLHDAEEALVTLTGCEPSDLLLTQGEETFRALERDVVARLLGEQTERVVVLGGGAALHPHTRADLVQALAAGDVLVFVDTSVARAVAELGWTSAPVTPVINARAQWLRMAADRREEHRRLGALIVDASTENVDEIVPRILGAGEPDPDQAD
ncbi:MAG: shikimate kinase [Actinomycetales bacterium]